MAQMVALSFGTALPPAQQTRAFVPNVPPIQQVAIPAQHPWTAGFNTRHIGHTGGCGWHTPCAAQEPPQW